MIIIIIKLCTSTQRISAIHFKSRIMAFIAEMALSTHLTPNLQQKPSIFEIFSAEYLDKICYPAFSRLFKFVNEKIPLGINTNLLSCGVLTGLQFLYLKKYGASFGECFYGLDRSNIENLNLELSKRQQVASVILLTLPEYLKVEWKDELVNGTGKRRFIPSIIILYNVMKTAFTLAFMMDRVKTHSALLWVLGIKIKYQQHPPTNDTFVFVLLKLFEVFAFFLQFMQWWSSNGQQKLDNLKNPPAFQKDINLTKNKCPICIQELQTPTACSLTGIVFCWKCISRKIQHGKSCPITNLPMDFKDLVRIFES